MVKLTVLSALAILAVQLSFAKQKSKDRRCCSNCPLFHGLMIEPGCDQCLSKLYLTVGQEAELKCLPCNAVFNTEMEQIKNAILFWNASNWTIMETQTNRLRTSVKIKSNKPHVETISCMHGNRTHADYQASKDVVVCGKLMKPNFKCITWTRNSTLVLKCSWKIPDHENVDEKFSRDIYVARNCNLSYGSARLTIKLSDAAGAVGDQFDHHQPIIMQNGNKPCGVYEPCEMKPACMRSDICDNHSLSTYIVDLSKNVLVFVKIRATSAAENAIDFEFLIPPLNQIFVHDNPPFIQSFDTHSCTIAINVSLPMLHPQFDNSSFVAFLKVVERQHGATAGLGRVIKEGSEPVIIPIPKQWPQKSPASILIDDLFPGQIYDIWMKYKLDESIYETNLSHLECRTMESVPVAEPRIPPGGYMISDGILKVFAEEVHEHLHGAPKFEYLVTITNEGSPPIKFTSASTPILVPFNNNDTLLTKVVLKLKNTLGITESSAEFNIAEKILNPRPDHAIARKLTQVVHDPSISRYLVSWWGINATRYILHWCTDTCKRVPHWIEVGDQENAIVCLNSGSVKFFVSACVREQCGPMMAMTTKDFERPPLPQIQTPNLDQTKSEVTLTWKSAVEFDPTGFMSQFEYRFDSDPESLINESKTSITCDRIKSRPTTFHVRHVMSFKPAQTVCNGALGQIKVFRSDWSHEALSPDLCHVADQSSTIVIASVALLMAALALLLVSGLVYLLFQRMAKKYMEKMLMEVDRVEKTYLERLAGQQEREQMAEDWYTEKYGNPPQYTVVNLGHRGQVRLPYLPPPDFDIPASPGPRSANEAVSLEQSKPIAPKVMRNIYAEQHNPAFSIETAATDTSNSSGSTASRSDRATEEDLSRPFLDRLAEPTDVDEMTLESEYKSRVTNA